MPLIRKRCCKNASCEPEENVFTPWFYIKDLFLILETTDLSWVSHEECSPLYLAAVEGHCAAASLLLEHGANPSQTDVMKNSPLIAGTNDKIYVLYMLCEKASAFNNMVVHVIL